MKKPVLVLFNSKEKSYTRFEEGKVTNKVKMNDGYLLLPEEVELFRVLPNVAITTWVGPT